MSTTTLSAAPNPQTATTSSRYPLHTVTPHIVCAGAASAIEFYKKAFGAEELMRLAGPDGKLIHAAIRIGDSTIMMLDEIPGMGCFGPKSLKGASVTLHLNVDDADALQQRAVAAGATMIMPVNEMFWGDRWGSVEDPFGHRWAMATHVRDVSPEEMQKAALSMQCGCPSE